MIIEEKKTKPNEFKPAEQILSLENRTRLSVTGVENVEGFSETSVALDTNLGRLVIKGEGLHISKLNVDDGGFSLDGKINSFEYLKKPTKHGSFFENLFR